MPSRQGWCRFCAGAVPAAAGRGNAAGQCGAVHWLGDPVSRALVMARPGEWVIYAALDGRAAAEPPVAGDAAAAGALLERIAEQPWAFAAMRAPAPSVVPCTGSAEALEPARRGGAAVPDVRWHGTGGLCRAAWRACWRRGMCRAAILPPDAISKDVWVLLEEDADIMGRGGLGNLSVPSLPIRRMAGDMPSRVADNFFWFGRYLERLENAARLTRAMLARLSQRRAAAAGFAGIKGAGGVPGGSRCGER